MKIWGFLIIVLMFGNGAYAASPSSSQSYIEMKRQRAEALKSNTSGKIEYLRKNKDKANIISTTPVYNLDDLETASGDKSSVTEGLTANAPATEAKTDVNTEVKSDAVKNNTTLPPTPVEY